MSEDTGEDMSENEAEDAGNGMDENMVREAIRQAVEGTLQQYGGFATTWVCLISSVEQDGSKSVWLLADKNMRAWESMGLLEYGLASERAEVVKDALSR